MTVIETKRHRRQRVRRAVAEALSRELDYCESIKWRDRWPAEDQELVDEAIRHYRLRFQRLGEEP